MMNWDSVLFCLESRPSPDRLLVEQDLLVRIIAEWHCPQAPVADRIGVIPLPGRSIVRHLKCADLDLPAALSLRCLNRKAVDGRKQPRNQEPCLSFLDVHGIHDGPPSGLPRLTLRRRAFSSAARYGSRKCGRPSDADRQCRPLRRATSFLFKRLRHCHRLDHGQPSAGRPPERQRNRANHRRDKSGEVARSRGGPRTMAA